MDDNILVLGIGNVLWADEGFGVRVVEALHGEYRFPKRVRLLDGGTQGLNLLADVKAARRLIIFDAIDFQLAPGTLKVVEDDEVPAWGATKMSLHQSSFQEVLALAQLSGCYPESVVLIGVQPEDLSDFGGSLRSSVRARVSEAVALGIDYLERWGVLPERRTRAPDESDRLNCAALDIARYEAGRPSGESACRQGDARVLGARPTREQS